MAINTVIVDGLTGGTNTRVTRVIPQTFDNSDATINAVTNRGYILTSATLQTINLPTPCTVGDVFALHGNGAGLFKVAQRAGEQITLGDKTTTLGVTGFIDSTNSGDEIYLICTDAAGKWKNDGGYGGILVINGITPVNTINNTISGDDVTLSGTGTGGTDMVTGGTGPNLTIAKINATTGVSGSFVGGVYTIVNTAPDQTVVLTSPAGNITFGGTYPALTGSVTNLAISALANRTAGQILTWSAVGTPTAVPTGDAGQVLTSNGVGDFPTFQDAAGGLEIGYVQMISTTTTTGWTGLTFSFTVAFAELVVAGATYFADNTANFIHTSDGKLQYTGPTKLFSITARYSMSGTENMAGAIAINGFQDTNSERHIQDSSTVTVQFPKILNTNDIVSLFVARLTAANRTVQSYSLTITG